jgi:hypothetical protein
MRLSGCLLCRVGYQKGETPREPIVQEHLPAETAELGIPKYIFVPGIRYTEYNS